MSFRLPRQSGVAIALCSAIAACVGDDPAAVVVPKSDASATDASVFPPATNDASVEDAASADASDLDGGDSSTPHCGPPALSGTETEEVLAGLADTSVYDFSFGCEAYYVVTSYGAVYRRPYKQLEWQRIVPPGSAQTGGWRIQVDTEGFALLEGKSAPFVVGTDPQNAVRVLHYSLQGEPVSGVPVRAEEFRPSVEGESVVLQGPFQRTADSFAFVEIRESIGQRPTMRRVTAQSGALGYHSKGRPFPYYSHFALSGGNTLALTRGASTSPPLPPRIEFSRSQFFDTVTTIRQLPEGPTATVSSFLNVAGDVLFFAATLNNASVPRACSALSRTECALLAIQPWRIVDQMTVTPTALIATDDTHVAVVIADAERSAISLCATADFSRPGSCQSSATIYGPHAGAVQPSALSLSASSVFVGYPRSTGSDLLGSIVRHQRQN